ncbi:MAG: Crp/Fnr family transcriptional regulator [Alphaproteobacteria bacterium]|nr:Crp/Fnr family transcriptional regulator [Alphaproteobacteria bacterium]
MRSATVCAALGDPQLEEVEAHKVGDHYFPAGSDLFLQGTQSEYLYTIKEGWVMLYTLLQDGRRQINEFCLTGAFIGCQSDMMGPSSYSAQALTGVTVCALPREGIDAVFQRVPEMAVRFACIATKSMESAFATLATVGRGTARERIAHLLADLEARSQVVQTESSAGPLALPITQEHIGDALGLTSVHVSRTLKQLREDDIVSLRGHALHILDRPALMDVAGITPHQTQT